MAAVDRVWYNENGLIRKPYANMRDNIVGCENINQDMLDWNISMFRKINNLK